MKDFQSNNLFTWCTNCGNYGIHTALRRALVAKKIPACQTLNCFDIGCNGNGSDKIGGYSFHGLHGRVIPMACGATMANSKMTVIAFGGDGGTLGEGVGHLVHAIRGNYNITFVLHNNLNYGLTKGQASPTTLKNMKMNSSPDGVTSELLHPANFVLSLESTFVARSFSGNVKHMAKTFEQALDHRGFSFVEILQSCPSYNKETPHEWYMDRVFDISNLADYDSSNRQQALAIAQDQEEKIAIGVLFQDKKSVPQIEKQPNRKDIVTDAYEETRHYDISKLLSKFR
ncbi:MAG: 2-oxoacid:ferredoxin oxidoreductase subunit beta [Pseudomonadales bacterium]|nr:2-oxoacid:ferredoxin oxidoreductase subunit beta [Pseudomonadales bacterium]